MSRLASVRQGSLPQPSSRSRRLTAILKKRYPLYFSKENNIIRLEWWALSGRKLLRTVKGKPDNKRYMILLFLCYYKQIHSIGLKIKKRERVFAWLRSSEYFRKSKKERALGQFQLSTLSPN